jgi:hypothetical protein
MPAEICCGRDRRKLNLAGVALPALLLAGLSIPTTMQQVRAEVTASQHNDTGDSIAAFVKQFVQYPDLVSSVDVQIGNLAATQILLKRTIWLPKFFSQDAFPVTLDQPPTTQEREN